LVVNPGGVCVTSEDNWTPSSKHKPHARRTAQVTQYPLRSIPVHLSVPTGSHVASQKAERVREVRSSERHQAKKAAQFTQVSAGGGHRKDGGDTKNLLKQGNEVRARPHCASSTSSSRVNSSSSCSSSAYYARVSNSSYTSSSASGASCSRLRRVSSSSSNNSTSSSSVSTLASSGSSTPTVSALNKPLTQLLRGQSR
ncbi:unnamed protein product, partial [Closterium sp. NIES-54]